MGRGNYLPPSSVEVSQMVYIDDASIYGAEDDPSERSDLWRLFVDDLKIRACRLSESLSEHDDWIRGAGHGNDLHVILECGLGFVGIKEEDTKVALIVGYVPDDYEPTRLLGLAERWVDSFADKLFDSLHHSTYALSVRTGPWTSTPYSPTS